MPAVPVGAAGEKFSKFDTFSCIFRLKNDKSCVFSLKIEKCVLYNKKDGVCGAAAGEKFLKFDAFLYIFKAFFRFLSGRGDVLCGDVLNDVLSRHSFCISRRKSAQKVQH